MAVLITAVLIMAELKPIQCQEQWLCSPFLAAIDPIYQIPVYCMQIAAPKSLGLQPQWVGSKYPTHSIHFGAHVWLSGGKFAWAKNEV